MTALDEVRRQLAALSSQRPLAALHVLRGVMVWSARLVGKAASAARQQGEPWNEVAEALGTDLTRSFAARAQSLTAGRRGERSL